jgi:hypothetical protein
LKLRHTSPSKKNSELAGMALGIGAPSMLILSIFILTPFDFRGEATEEKTGIIITVQIKNKTVTEI